MDERLDKMDDRLAGMGGRSLATQATNHIANIVAQELNLRRSRVLLAPGRDHNPELEPALDAAVAAGRITEDQADNLLLTDVIIQARRRESREQVQVVFEISRTINQHDIERARDRAATLEAATGQTTIPAVLGQHIDPRQREQANQLAVAVLLPAILRSPWDLASADPSP